MQRHGPLTGRFAECYSARRLRCCRGALAGRLWPLAARRRPCGARLQYQRRVELSFFGLTLLMVGCGAGWWMGESQPVCSPVLERGRWSRGDAERCDQGRRVQPDALGPVAGLIRTGVRPCGLVTGLFGPTGQPARSPPEGSGWRWGQCESWQVHRHAPGRSHAPEVSPSQGGSLAHPQPAPAAMASQAVCRVDCAESRRTECAAGHSAVALRDARATRLASCERDCGFHCIHNRWLGYHPF